MSGFDPQESWIQWAATTVVGIFSALIGLLVAFGRDAHKIYREKVDALEKEQAEFAAKFVTRADFKEELERLRTEFKAEMVLRFDAVDNRHIQMHNHNATLMGAVESRLNELKNTMDTRMGELRGDIKDIHKRIDEDNK